MIQEIKSGGDGGKKGKNMKGSRGTRFSFREAACLLSGLSLHEDLLCSRVLSVSFACWYIVAVMVMHALDGEREEEAGDGGWNCSF